MPKHKLLYDYLTERAEDISQTWFDTLHETDPDSVYASTDPAVLTNLKKQNLAFNYQLNRIFLKRRKYIQRPWKSGRLKPHGIKNI